jgi:hypothetical protein
MRTLPFIALFLASNVSARFIPAWFLDHPTILVSNPDDPAFIRSIEESNIIRIIEQGLL